MHWDPFGTIQNTLWIGGGQWAGKSTVARLLSRMLGLTTYHYDLHHALGHEDRRMASIIRNGGVYSPIDPEEFWVNTPPTELVKMALDLFQLRFDWVLDDLRALCSYRPIIAEGWGIRPRLVAPLIRSRRQMVVLVPTEEFQLLQFERLPHASVFSHTLSDKATANRHKLARNRMLADEAAISAEELGMRVVRVDGTVSAIEVASMLADHFSPLIDNTRCVS